MQMRIFSVSISWVANFDLLSVCTDSRDDAEGPLLAEEEGQSDLASFQATESDVPSFLADGNRVRWFFPTRSAFSALIYLTLRIKLPSCFAFSSVGQAASWHPSGPPSPKEHRQRATARAPFH